MGPGKEQYMRKSLIAAAAIAALCLIGAPSMASATNGGGGGDECVPSEAIPGYWEDVPDITHPAVGEPKITVENPDYQPATDGTSAIWANFSPNDQQATFVGPATYPTDERGTWHDHGQLPPGQAGPDGVYANGNPDKGGNWFYRQAAVPGTDAVGTPTIEIDNPDYKPERIEVTPNKWHDPVAAVECDPEEPQHPTNECTTGVSTHSTNLAPLWSNVDTRSAGHYEYVEGGLHVWTDDNSSNAKVSLGQAANFPLHDTGVISLGWTGTTPPPGVNLFITSEHGNGTLVYESVYGQDLWLTNGSSAGLKANAPVDGGGNGSQWHGTIDQWLTKIPGAQVVGIAFSLGSGVLGDGVISSITVGCGTHTFDYVEPVVAPEKPADIVTVTETESTDCETKTVTTTTTTTTTGHVLVDNVWVEAEPVVTQTSSERPATAEECPVVVDPPVEEPEEPTPPVVTPEEPEGETPVPAVERRALAVTGGSDVSTIGFAAAGIILLGALATLLTRTRRQH